MNDASGIAPATARGRGGYHHGDLRAALLAAGEAELAQNGVESFSLRAVARRAGVSHAAPAHHFASADALLTALSALSFERFAAAMRARADAAGDEPAARLAAITCAYVAYASDNPAMFDLQFASSRPDRSDPAWRVAAEAAFSVLEDTVATVLAVRGRDASELEEAAAMVWAQAHGLASLFARRKAGLLSCRTPEEREAAFARIARRLARAL
ncbi:TetR/AcrR family transcriptional regulator [Salinarimonas sp. NSM]|uniref:TetR/AcrR family transcriptional regulator n=1 Tax=Salinarimonas sp. NSM TaxID=3458003 RepID=UPI0040359D09